MRNRQVPLIAVGRTEVCTDGIEARAGAHARDGTSETGIDCIQATEGRIVGKIRGASSPVRGDCSRPGRIPVHA